MSEEKREPTDADLERARLVLEAEERQVDRLNDMMFESTDRHRDLISAYVVTRATLIMNGYGHLLEALDHRAEHLLDRWRERGFGQILILQDKNDDGAPS